MLRSHIDIHVGFLTSKQIILSWLVKTRGVFRQEEKKLASIEDQLLSIVKRPQPGIKKCAFPTQRGRGQTLHTEDL